jgi:23S rRNA maturation mini-RNase III
MREAQVDALAGLMAYLLKDQVPLEICIRIFLIAYVIRPELINGMTLSQIGKHLGGISKQRICAKLKKQDKIIPYHGRNRKSEEQRKIYSESQKKAWEKRRKK